MLDMLKRSIERGYDITSRARLSRYRAAWLLESKRRPIGEPTVRSVRDLSGCSITVITDQTAHVRGANLQNQLVTWLTEAGAEVTVVNFSMHKQSVPRESDGIAIAYEVYKQFKSRKTIRHWSQPLLTRSLGILAPLPDTFDPRLNLLASELIRDRPGALLMLQNTAEECGAFGLSRVTQPTPWTWPRSSFQAWRGDLPWIERPRLALVAGSGGSQRLRRLAPVEAMLSAANYSVGKTDYSLSWPDYVSQVRNCRIVATTNLTQEIYSNSILLSRRISPTTMTGRSWEAFASGALLIANEAGVLTGLGFLPEEHYIPIGSLTAATFVGTGNDRALMRIAQAGQEQFFNFVSSWSAATDVES